MLRPSHETKMYVFMHWLSGRSEWNHVWGTVYFPWISSHQRKIIHAVGSIIKDATDMGIDGEVDVPIAIRGCVAPEGGDEGGACFWDVKPS